MVLKPLFTMWVGVHHYARSWQLQPEQGKMHQRVVGIVECGFSSNIPPFSLCRVTSLLFGQKQIIRRKYFEVVWFCGCCC